MNGKRCGEAKLIWIGMTAGPRFRAYDLGSQGLDPIFHSPFADGALHLRFIDVHLRAAGRFHDQPLAYSLDNNGGRDITILPHQLHVFANAREGRHAARTSGRCPFAPMASV